MEEPYRLFIDVDSGEGWLWRINDKMWDDLLPLVRMEAKRLQALYNLGPCCLMRSDNGWHIRFNKAGLTKMEEEALMVSSNGHRGHIYFSLALHDTTLRVGEKPLRGSHRPILREIINE